MANSVFLSAGHGGNNPGAAAYGLKEKDINLQTLLGCKAELERHGVEVVASRTVDENDDVYEEVREAGESTWAEQRAFGAAYAKAILEYLGIAYKDGAVEKPGASERLYRIQVGAYSKKAGAKKMVKALKEAGLDGAVRYSSEEKLYRVQAGAYTVFENAEKMKDRVTAKGFNAFINED